jgi:Tol biopolymer transport system component
MPKLYEELKRRKVFRVAAVYAVVAWVLIQVTDVVLPTFGAPGWVNQTIIFLFILGFLPTLIAAWAYEVTPDGVRADAGGQLNQIVSSNSSNTNSTDRKLIYAIFVLVLLVAGFQITDRFITGANRGGVDTETNSTQTAQSQIMRANLLLGDSFTNDVGFLGSFSISPDGQRLARISYLRDGGASAIIHDLTTATASVLPASSVGENPVQSAFSPSGERILFFNERGNAAGELFTVNLNGGGSQRVADDVGGSPAWFTEQSVIYRPSGSRDFHVVGWNGGVPDPLGLEIEPGMTPSRPIRLVETPWVIYRKSITGGGPQGSTIEAFNIETKETKKLIDPGLIPSYASSGHLVFTREGDLWAVAIDPVLMELTGNEVMIEQGIESGYTFSTDGRLVYRRGLDSQYSRNAEVELSKISGDPITHTIPIDAVQGRFSPNGEDIVFMVGSDRDLNAGSDIAVYDISEQQLSQRTFTGRADRPLWTPDGSQIVYRQRPSLNSDTFGIWRTNADGSGEPQQLLSAESSLSPTSFSPDAMQLVFSQGLGPASEVKVLSLAETENPIRNLFSSNDFQQDTAEISPDGRWIVYSSLEVGGQRILVRPYPNIEDGRWLVSDIQAKEAHWAGNNMLYFQVGQRDEGSGMIYRVPVDFQSGAPAFGTAELMFRSRHFNSLEPNFGVSPDGETILYSGAPIEVEVENDNLVLVENWFERLRQLAPPNPN